MRKKKISGDGFNSLMDMLMKDLIEGKDSLHELSEADLVAKAAQYRADSGLLPIDSEEESALYIEGTVPGGALANVQEAEKSTSTANRERGKPGPVVTMKLSEHPDFKQKEPLKPTEEHTVLPRGLQPKPLGRGFIAVSFLSEKKSLTSKEETVVRDLYHKGLSDFLIAESTGLLRTDVAQWRRANGLPHNGEDAEFQNLVHNIGRGQLDTGKAFDMLAEGVPSKDIAEALGASISTINRFKRSLHVEF